MEPTMHTINHCFQLTSAALEQVCSVPVGLPLPKEFHIPFVVGDYLRIPGLESLEFVITERCFAFEEGITTITYWIDVSSRYPPASAQLKAVE
jgi:hypothetical protein